MKIHLTLFIRFVALIIFILLFFGLNAQTVKDTTHTLGDVVITASKSNRSTGNVTQLIDIIPATTIQNTITANRNLAELLGHSAGASVSVLSRNDANWGTYAGIGPKYCTWMLQGLPVDGFTDPMALDINIVERIEVQRGPASVLYPTYLSQDFAGVQSPLAGTVNLVLKEWVDETRTVASMSYGSYNTLNSSLFHQGRTGNLHYFGGASWESSDYTDYGIENSWLNMKDDPEYRKTKIYGGLAYHPAKDQKLTLFWSKTMHAGDAGRVYRGFDHGYDFVNAGYTTTLNKKLKLQSNMGIRNTDRSWQESHFNLVDSLLSNNGVRQRIIPMDVALSFEHLKNSVLTLGTDMQLASYATWTDPLVGYETYGNKSSAHQTGIYAQEEFNSGKLTLRAGLRYSMTNYSIDLVSGGAPGSREQDWSTFIWSAGLKYRLSSRLSVFGNVGNSFIPPGLKSTGGTIRLEDKFVVGRNGQLPNPDLKPENGTGIDLGIRLRTTGDLNATMRAYHIVVDDAIVENVVSQNPSQTQSVNAGKSVSRGLEFEFRRKASAMFEWFANYTLMSTSISNDLDADQDGSEIPFAPSHIINAGINIQTSFGMNLTPVMNYNEGYYDSSSQTGRTRFTPGLIMNLYVSQVIKQGDRVRAELFGQFYNITDNRYEMPWQFRNTGFSGNGGLRISF